MKVRLKTTSFWLGICSAIVIIVESVLGIFDIDICSGVIENILFSICSILVLTGIITKKSTEDKEDSSVEELLDEFDNKD